MGEYYLASKSLYKSVYKEMKDTYSAEDIVEYLQRRAKLLGRTPRVKDLNLDREGPSKKQIEKVFSSYDDAISAAGLEPLPRPWSAYGDDELIELLLKWHSDHPDAIMTCSLLRDNPDLPSPTLIRQRFGNVSGWFRAAGIEYKQADRSPFSASRRAI